MKFSEFKRGKTKMEKLDLQTELIRIFCYSLMPNHFHLLIQQLQEGGVTTFLRKSLDSYAKFFNTKYDRVGPLFQGSFKAKLIEKDEYLLQLSKYIHRNIFTLSMCEGKIYSYSSYNYYLSRETHPFCDKDFILSYFSKTNPNLGYKEFVEEELDDPSLYSLLIDPEE
ncbi:MAG: transposase [bacterium]|nr:transposase [bacterium]